MNALVEQINSSGRGFVEFALPMLIQSSVLIAILLAADFVLRKKVRAVFRYWLWMLVLIKLVLPVSLSSPVSIGRFLAEPIAKISVAETPKIDNRYLLPTVVGAAAPKADLPPAEPVRSQSSLSSVELAGPALSLTWQGGVFLLWLGVTVSMLLLLLQRAFFVCGLVRQAKEANILMKDMLRFCVKKVGVRGEVGLKVSPNATSPAVCGLFRPVILLPHGIGSNLGSSRLRTVLMHELAHIKRGDLWVNLIQTLLQIFYFYNPLLWLANWMIRRVREQAVDEVVQVALGEKAGLYPETLLNVARLAFERPALSLRLIGVVESKSALTGRIKRMLNQPAPRSAKLGVIGLAVLLVAGAVLLPMAKAAKMGGQKMDIQSRCEEIVKRMAEVNRYWLIGPPAEVKRYSYEFALYQGELKTFKVTDPLSAQNTIRQGITYDSIVQQLAKKPSATNYTVIEESDGSIRIDFILKEPVQIRVGNGIKGSWYGYFNRQVEEGTLWIDAAKMVPVSMKCNEVYEYFSDYTAFDKTHYVPLRVKVDSSDMHFDWNFKLHKPGLWLFDVSHYLLDGNSSVVAASISNVRINEDLSAGSDSGQGETAADADGNPPVVVKTAPETFANDVSPDLDKLAVTFDQKMADGAWAWVRWDAPYPETVGSPYYDEEKKTCTLPVKLEPGRAYLVAFNIEPYIGFRNTAGKAAAPYVLVFATKDKDGRPTPIPEELITRAKSINKQIEKMPSEPKEKGAKDESIPYSQIMYGDIQPDGTILFKNTVKQVNRTGSPVSRTSFINSKFVDVTAMADGKGRALKFTTTDQGEHWQYSVEFNEPIGPGEVIEYSHEGRLTGLISEAPGSQGEFIYHLRHWPSAGEVTRRVDTFLLPAGAELISTTPEDMERREKDGRIELHVEKMIPAGDSITTSFRYRLGEGEESKSSSGLEELMDSTRSTALALFRKGHMLNPWWLLSR